MITQSTLTRSTLLLLISCSLACTAYPPLEELCAEASQYAATVTAGSGTEAFEEVAEDTILRPSFGAQGGHHIWTSVQTTGVNPGLGEMVSSNSDLAGGANLEPAGQAPVTIQTQILLEGNLAGPYVANFTNFLVGTGESAQLLALTAFIDMWDINEVYPEQDTVAATMAVTITDGCDTVVTDARPFAMQLEGVPLD